MEQNYSFDVEDIKNNRAIAALSYIFVLFLIPMVIRRKSRFCRKSVKQGLALFAWEAFVWIISPILYIIPFVGSFFVSLFFIISIMFGFWGIKNALEGKIFIIPIIGKYFEKLKILK